MSATVVSTGAATRNVWGGLFRSTKSGFFAQESSKLAKTDRNTTKARERQDPGIDITFSDETGLCTGRFGFVWGPTQPTSLAKGLSTAFSGGYR